MSLPSRAKAAAYAAATTLLLAPAAALAAAEKKGVPAQPSHGEDTPLKLADDAPRQLSDTGGSSGGGLVRTFVGLAIVIGVIYGLYWVLRQVKSSREERSSGTGLSSAAVVPLGPNRSLHLVRAGRELVLLGVAEHGVTPIRRYTEAEALELGLVGMDSGPSSTNERGTAPGIPGSKPRPMTIGQAIAKLREKTVRS